MRKLTFFFVLGLMALPACSSKPEIRALQTQVHEDFKPLRVNAVRVETLKNGLQQKISGEELDGFTADLRKTFEIHTSLELVDSAPQAFLLGTVNSYRKMQGTRLGASQTALVGFRLQLVDAKNKQILWTASFFREEKPLSDNLFQAPEILKRGVGFRTSRELMNYGFKQAALKLEKLRKQ